MIEILCNGKFLKDQLVKDIFEQIDADKSNTVTFKELVEAFITNLDLENVIEADEVEKIVSQEI